MQVPMRASRRLVAVAFVFLACTAAPATASLRVVTEDVNRFWVVYD